MSQGNVSALTFFTKSKTLWDEYVILLEVPTCSCGAGAFLRKILQNQQIMQFLMGLNDAFNNVRGSILMTRPFPNIDQIFQIVTQDETQREITQSSSPTPDASAFSASYGRGRGKSPPDQQQTGKGKTKNNYYCDHCKTPGHSISRCFKIHGKPANFSGEFCEHYKIPV